MVTYLVENQADFKLKNTAGENALDLARKRNRQKTVEYLETKIKKE
jgi:ankyrin repeat protein